MQVLDFIEQYWKTYLEIGRLEIMTRSQNEPMQIKLRLVSIAKPGDLACIQIYNIMVRICFQLLELTLMGRNYFDHTSPIQMPQHRLSLWPGFVSTLRQHDAGMLYCVELTHKVIRMDTQCRADGGGEWCRSPGPGPRRGPDGLGIS